MYSFYGGQKGQDFKISRIFSNRSEDLLQDLQARWYSPVNVGDYVLISYGDIAELNKIIKNQQGQTIEVESTYNRNLNIDLLNCGKSYTNSIWQKVYIEDKKNISPDFPNSEENVFIFINFEESPIIEEKDEEGNIQKYILDKEGIRRKCDDEGNWINELGQIIRFKQVPGYSLLETSDIYSEENYGFGYRLITCVTGQTPRIQVFHEIINIEDGDPYVTYDLTNPDRPAIKFYLQRNQRIEDIYTTILPPTQNPNIDILINNKEYREINGEKKYASLTHPILDVQIPRAIKYYSGLMFGQGDLAHYYYSYSTDEPLGYANGIEYQVTAEECTIISLMSEFLREAFLANLNENNKLSLVGFNDYIKQHIGNKNAKIQPYYCYEKNLLFLLNQSDLTEERIPWGQYGLNKEEAKKSEDLKLYCKKIASDLSIISSRIEKYVNKESQELDLEEYWKKFGLLEKAKYDLLDEQEKYQYLVNYLKGVYSQNNLILIANLYQFYTPLVNIRSLLLKIDDNNENDFEYTEDEIRYVLNVLEKLCYLKMHFSYLKNESLSGDIYINTSSGRLYQFISSEAENILRARYLGKMTSPVPEVAYETKAAYEKQGEEYVESNITVRNNLLLQNDELGYREKYVFSIPNTPKIVPSIQPINNRENPEIKKIISNENDLNFNFNLPLAVKIFTFDDLDYFDYENMVPVLKSDLSLNLYDIYIHTTFDLKDDYRGWFFIYNKINEEKNAWVKQGSILGPIGIPEPINILTINAVYDQPKGVITPAKSSEIKERIMRTGVNDFQVINQVDLSSASITCSVDLFKKGEIYIYGSIIEQNSDVAKDLYWTYELDYSFNDSTKKITFNQFIEGSAFQLYLVSAQGTVLNKTYWVNIDELSSLNSLVDQITKSYFETSEYPDGAKGKITLIKIYESMSKATELKPGDNYWGQYNIDQKQWYLTLITSQGSYMSDSKIDSLEQAQKMTYTASYINDIVPMWDTDTYY